MDSCNDNYDEEVFEDHSEESLGEIFSNTLCDEEPTGEYYFESDPPSLKNDKDYQSILKVLVKLQCQKAQAVKDLEKLVLVREQVLKDPLQFVQSIQNGEDLDLPRPIKIARVPDIDFEAKYNVQEIVESMKPKTRKKERITRVTQNNFMDSEEVDEKNKVKSLLGNASKSQTFNQPWSAEEQRELEKLLIQYPDEPVASQRWKKIADEMGNRTTLQVQSRVQKFFLYLKKKGLAVPGKPPTAALTRQQARRKRHANGESKSSFGNAFDFETQQDAGQGAPGQYVDLDQPDLSDEDDIPASLKSSDEYETLLNLKHILRDRLRDCACPSMAELSVQCSACYAKPITGLRWHCTQCPVTHTTNFCNNCVHLNANKGQHLVSHHLKLIPNAGPIPKTKFSPKVETF